MSTIRRGDSDSEVIICFVLNLRYQYLSHDVASGSEITPCNKINKPLVVYRFMGKVMTSIITLRKRWPNLDVFMPNIRFLISYNVRCYVINKI